MGTTSIAVESVKNLQANSKRSLEDILGLQLQENEQVVIMVLSHHQESDDVARSQAEAGLRATFQKTAAFAEEHAIADEEIEAAIHEAMVRTRHRND